MEEKKGEKNITIKSLISISPISFPLSLSFSFPPFKPHLKSSSLTPISADERRRTRRRHNNNNKPHQWKSPLLQPQQQDHPMKEKQTHLPILPQTAPAPAPPIPRLLLHLPSFSPDLIPILTPPLSFKQIPPISSTSFKCSLAHRNLLPGHHTHPRLPNTVLFLRRHKTHFNPPRTSLFLPSELPPRNSRVSSSMKEEITSKIAS